MKSNHNIGIFLVIVFILIGKNSSSQSLTPIGITFGTSTYQVIKAEKYSDALASTDEILFFKNHFSNTSYVTYQTFYYNNSCLTNEEEFKSWHDNLEGKIITPEAFYKVNSPSDTLCVIAYSISSGAVKQYFPLALQKQNQKWYLLDLKKSGAYMNMKMFMTFVQPDFLHRFLSEPEAMKKQYISTLYTARGDLNGDLMMNYYEDRYDPAAKRYDIAKATFHDVAEMDPATVEKMTETIHQIALEYKIPEDKQVILENISRAGNYSMAISKIAKWSDTFDVIEIADKFNSRMMAPVNNH